MKITTEIVAKLDELTITCAEIDKRDHRVQAIKTINDLRYLVGVMVDIESSFKDSVQVAPIILNPKESNVSVAKNVKINKPKDLKLVVEDIGEPKDLMLRQIQNCNLTYRTENCLRTNKVFYVGDLVEKTEGELLSIKNFGKSCLIEVQEFLSEDGLTLRARNSILTT